MAEIFDIVLPVFVLIALGYGAARSGYLTPTVGDGLSTFVFNVAVPLLLMRSIATATITSDNTGISLFAYWASYFSGVAVVWLAAMILIGKVFGRGARAASISGVAAGFSNLVLLGIPLIQRAYGQEGLQILLVLVSVHLPIMMGVSTLLMEVAARRDGTISSPLKIVEVLFEVLRNLAGNPIIWGIAAGLVWRFSGLPFSGLTAQVTGLLAQTTGPLALFALGMSFVKFGIRGNILPALGLSALSLIVMPTVVYMMAVYIFDLPSLWLKVAVIAAACPTGVNAFLFAIHFKTAEGLSTNTIVLALLGSVITLPLWLALVGS